MSDLGDLLALLHDGPDRVRRLRADIVTQTDMEAAAAALRSVADHGGGGIWVALPADGDGGAASPVWQSRTRIWIDRDEHLGREELTGAHQSLAVRRGGTWWSWNPEGGIDSNEDEDMDMSLAADRRWILGGLRVLSSLWIEPLGPGEVAGRRTIRCRATRRATGGDETSDWQVAHLPGYGADAYELEIDSEHGLILRVAATFEGATLSTAELVELGIDETFPDDLFVLVPPDE